MLSLKNQDGSMEGKAAHGVWLKQMQVGHCRRAVLTLSRDRWWVVVAPEAPKPPQRDKLTGQKESFLTHCF